jgi:hypothetical protein
MKTSPGREKLKKLIGKKIVEVSQTDFEDYRRTNILNIYLLCEDGTVFRSGPYGFHVYAPGEYEGQVAA